MALRALEASMNRSQRASETRLSKYASTRVGRTSESCSYTLSKYSCGYKNVTRRLVVKNAYFHLISKGRFTPCPVSVK